MPQWHGGKGSGRRKGADNDKYRNEYDRIFDQRHSSSTKGNSNTGQPDGNTTQGSTRSNIQKT